MDKLHVIADSVAETGLVVGEDYENNRLGIARPASLHGTKFRGWQEDEEVVGYWGGMVKSNAPSASVNAITKGKKVFYNLNISLGAAPGPGAVWIDETFKNHEDVVTAIIGCYFGDRIDFSNASLESWFPNKT